VSQPIDPPGIAQSRSAVAVWFGLGDFPLRNEIHSCDFPGPRFPRGLFSHETHSHSVFAEPPSPPLSQGLLVDIPAGDMDARRLLEAHAPDLFPFPTANGSLFAEPRPPPRGLSAGPFDAIGAVGLHGGSRIGGGGTGGGGGGLPPSLSCGSWVFLTPQMQSRPTPPPPCVTECPLGPSVVWRRTGVQGPPGGGVASRTTPSSTSPPSTPPRPPPPSSRSCAVGPLLSLPSPIWAIYSGGERLSRACVWMCRP